jgi:hypothetical protein
MEKKVIVGLPDPFGIVEKITEKHGPFKLVDPFKHFTGFELREINVGLPPASPLSGKWARAASKD